MSLKSIHQSPTFHNELDSPITVSGIPSKKVEDSQLWHEFQLGSEIAYTTIYRNNASLLHTYGLKLVQDKSLVKDCIQDLFVEIWDRKHRLGTVKSIKAYLFKSLRRKLISEASKKRKTDNIEYLDMLNYSVPSQERRLIEKQQFDMKRLALEKAMKGLTNKQLEIVHLKFHARLSYDEISEIMALNKKATYKLMGRSIQYLRTHLALS